MNGQVIHKLVIILSPLVAHLLVGLLALRGAESLVIFASDDLSLGLLGLGKSLGILKVLKPHLSFELSGLVCGLFFDLIGGL